MAGIDDLLIEMELAQRQKEMDNERLVRELLPLYSTKEYPQDLRRRAGQRLREIDPSLVSKEDDLLLSEPLSLRGRAKGVFDYLSNLNNKTVGWEERLASSLSDVPEKASKSLSGLLKGVSGLDREQRLAKYSEVLGGVAEPIKKALGEFARSKFQLDPSKRKDSIKHKTVDVNSPLFGKIFSSTLIDDSLESPNTTAAVQTSADYTKAIKDNMAKEAARNIQDNQKILKQLGIGEYISQEASKASPFFVIKGNEPSTSDSKTKGFSRSSRSIGEKAREDNYSKVLQAIESGDFSSASGALSGLPKEDKANFLALINEAQKNQVRGSQKDSLPIELVGKIKFLEMYQQLPPEMRSDPELMALAKESAKYLSSLKGI